MVLTDSHHVPTTDTLTGNSSKNTKNIWNDNFFSEIDDESLMRRLTAYSKKLAKEKVSDPTLMTKEEYFAMLDEAEQQLKRGEGMTMLPGEDLTAFLKRNGYEI